VGQRYEQKSFKKYSQKQTVAAREAKNFSIRRIDPTPPIPPAHPARKVG
jgi:hypothetical protein